MAELIADLITFYTEHPATMITFTVVAGLIFGAVANIIFHAIKGD